MTAAKFKPLIFSVSGFALSNVANICIFMILDDFCLLPALELELEFSLGIGPPFGTLDQSLFCSSFVGQLRCSAFSDEKTGL
jgi:hypothetical protein